MNISNISVSFRTAIMVLVLLLTVGGVVSYTTLPKEANPEIEIPMVLVTTIYPGASPSDVESLITQPIEQELQGISGIDEIRSTSAEGASIIIIEFVAGTNTTDAYQRARDRVDQARPELPDDAEDPTVSEIDLEDFPIMTVNLAAPYSITRLQRVADRLQDELEAVPGVLEVERVGGVEREVQVNVDLHALQTYNLSFDSIAGAIQREHANIPGGSIDVDRLNYLVRIDGEIRDPEELNHFVISAEEGVPVYLQDVAEIDFGFEDRASYARMRVVQMEEDDGEGLVPNEDEESLQVISLNVKQRTGSNTLETAGAVQSILDEHPFPNGTDIIITGDRSEDVETLVSDLENNIISGLIFVVLILLFFLGVRNASLVAVAIPLSMFLTFIILQAMGVSLNFIVLFTLIVALGILVDNAIVIIENIYRYREEGRGRLEAARMGAAEFTGAITVATLTMVLTFSPLLFWPGIVGEFMGYLPLTLIIALASSLFVAVFVGPALMAIFGRTPDEPKRPLSRPAWYAMLAALGFGVLLLAFTNWITLLVVAVAVPLLVGLYRVAFKPLATRFIERWLPAMVAGHRRLLAWIMQRDYDVRRPYLRNTLVLGAFTTGILLLTAGGVVAMLANSVAGSILLVPGGLLAALGMLGLLFHTFEALYLGGRRTVRAGLVFGLVMLVLIGLIWVGPPTMTLEAALVIMVLPALVIAAGLLGWLFGRRSRLVLTDNRALVINATLGSFFIILGLFSLAPTGVAFFPETDPNQVLINMEAPLGTNIDASNQIAQVGEERMDGLISREDAVRLNIKNVLTNVGVPGGGPFGGGLPQAEQSRMVINLVDYADRREASSETMRRVRETFEDIYPGVALDIEQDAMGPPTGMPVNIEISGPDFNQIAVITREVREMLEQATASGEIEGLVDLRDNLELGRPELRVEVDRERAARYGLSTSQVAQTVRSAVSGLEVATYRDGEDEYDITARLAPEYRASLESLENLTITNPMGERVPLVSVADFVEDEGVGAVTRLNQRRLSTITGRNAPDYSSQEVLVQVQDYLSEYREELPQGYTMSFTGEQEDQDEAFGFLLFALFAGIMLIFLVTVAKFNALSAPLLVLLAVGLSQIGVAFTLLLTRTPFSLMVFVGIISLFGILVNNNIVLLDYINQLRRQGLSRADSIVEGASKRLRPVLLTALTTILALLPLTLGLNVDFRGLLLNLEPAFQFGSQNTQFWGPMGFTIIGGLIFSLFITLVLIPAIFSAFESLTDRLGLLFAGEAVDGEPYAGDGAATRPSEAGRPATVPQEDDDPGDSLPPHNER